VSARDGRHLRGLSMKMLRFSAIALLLLPAVALAQIDRDPNGIGIYFDQAATQVLATTDTPSQSNPVTVDAWLIATHCSLIGEVNYWEGGVSLSPMNGWITGGASWGFNVADNMCCGPNWYFQVLVGETVPVTNPLVLAHLTIGLYEGGPTYLYVAGVHISVPGTGMTLHPSSGAENLPVAVINGEAPVRVVPVTWGAVKDLYGR